MKNRTVEYFPGDDKNEDVEGHVVNRLSSEGEYDVQGHGRLASEVPDAEDDVEAERRITLAREDDDDVEAHVQPPRDLDIERF